LPNVTAAIARHHRGGNVQAVSKDGGLGRGRVFGIFHTTLIHHFIAGFDLG